MLEIGKSYKLFFGEGNINNKIIHVLAIVDDDMVVYKWYGFRKTRWFYIVDSKYLLELYEKDGSLKEIVT
jgi:hypothetical protein